jgi:uncharacterized OB-fold protein
MTIEVSSVVRRSSPGAQLRREPPRRPHPERPAARPSARHDAWKFGFGGTRCVSCGTVDQMAPERLADVPGTMATYTVDRLAYSPSPPVVVAVIDFDGCGRFQGELADVDPATVRIGDGVEMTFRRLATAEGSTTCFWKARPIRGGQR